MRTMDTRYGFRWGRVEVERLLEHKGHRLMMVTTDRQQLKIRVTPSGLIRIEEHGPTSRGKGHPPREREGA
jgi:hypothetical protein